MHSVVVHALILTLQGCKVENPQFKAILVSLARLCLKMNQIITKAGLVEQWDSVWIAWVQGPVVEGKRERGLC